MVGKTLHNALWQFHSINQQAGGVFGQLHIWADTLCIDQGNEEEVKVELKRIRTVYSDASLVLV